MSIIHDEYGDVRFVWLYSGALLLTPLLATLVIALIASPFILLSYHSTKTSCPLYSEQTGRETKFIDNFPYWWSCQVKTKSGWIEYNKLQQLETPNIQIKE